jgi:hypothetical protein
MADNDKKRWGAHTWAGAEQARREQDRKMSFREKLEWNAQALALAKHTEAARQKAGSGELRAKSNS